MDNQKLMVSTSNGIQFLEEDDILACRANGNYTTLCLKSGRQHIITKKLKDIESILSNSAFFRIHHSHIINLRHLVRMDYTPVMRVVLRDGLELEVSKRKRSSFLALFTKF